MVKKSKKKSFFFYYLAMGLDQEIGKMAMESTGRFLRFMSRVEVVRKVSLDID